MATRDQVQQIKDQSINYFRKDRSGKGYICPICKDGDGIHGRNGITTKDGIHFTCWHSCFTSADIFEIIGKERGISDFNEQIKAAAEALHISLEDNKASSVKPKAKAAARIEEGPGKETDFTEYYTHTHKRIHNTDYPQRRGLGAAIVERFNLGYDPEWKHPKAPASAPATPRLIIPITAFSYLARDTRSEIPEEQQQYKKSKAKGKEGASWVFNAAALTESTQPVFILEGEIDALSVIEAGGEATAIGSTAYVRGFLEECKEHRPAQPLIIALDNDGAGKEAAAKLAAGLEDMGIEAYTADITAGHKDANEALTADRAAFIKAVEEAKAKAAAQHSEAEEEQRQEYINANSAAAQLKEFLGGIFASADTPSIPTGFKKLDRELGGDIYGDTAGGLYEGLYVIGAISSIGKTTLAMQICDQIAQQGKDTLIFSLEMARSELMAKSISRHTYQESTDTRLAKTARGITDGARWPKYTADEEALIDKAVGKYKEYAGHIFITEGMGDIGVKQIREGIAEHIRFTGNTPIVLVDYLQILAPYNERYSDKQNTDKAILELKRISRDYKTPVIVISSFNRQSYRAAAVMEAFKESGAIEYSADVLIGLQLKGAEEEGFNPDQEKRKDPRELELVILKNRNGKSGGKIGFRYRPQFNYFEEC